jgi:hypothetical protein
MESVQDHESIEINHRDARLDAAYKAWTDTNVKLLFDIHKRRYPHFLQHRNVRVPSQPVVLLYGRASR